MNQIWMLESNPLDPVKNEKDNRNAATQQSVAQLHFNEIMRQVIRNQNPNLNQFQNMCKTDKKLYKYGK
jgi:hypothetical protein